MSRTIDLIREAGFEAGEVEASRHLRGRICNGSATAEDQLAYAPFAQRWNEYARLEAQRDQADQFERQAPDPTRHSGDTSLGEAIREHRDGQSGRRLTVVRPRLIAVDTGNGGMMDVPEAPEWPMYRGSAGASGHQRIAAGLSSADKKR